MITLVGILSILLDVVGWIVIAQVVLSLLIAFNVINTYNDAVRQIYGGLTQLTEPLYRPIRRVMPDFGPIDFSPAVVLIGLQILRFLLARLVMISYGGAW